jgi:hypothetical protein
MPKLLQQDMAFIDRNRLTRVTQEIREPAYTHHQTRKVEKEQEQEELYVPPYKNPGSQTVFAKVLQLNLRAEPPTTLREAACLTPWRRWWTRRISVPATPLTTDNIISFIFHYSVYSHANK